MVYIDTSAIVKLYIKEPASGSVSKWVKGNNESIPLTGLIELEFINALKLKQFRNEISKDDFDNIILTLREHESRGVYYRPSMDWLAVFAYGMKLSETHSENIGSRSLDILHVSSAIFLKTEKILTFDERQARLSALAGLKVADVAL